jgi:hypothetical protein
VGGTRSELTSDARPVFLKEVPMRAGYAPIGIIGTIVLIVLILWLLGAF